MRHDHFVPKLQCQSYKRNKEKSRNVSEERRQLYTPERGHKRGRYLPFASAGIPRRVQILCDYTQNPVRGGWQVNEC